MPVGGLFFQFEEYVSCAEKEINVYFLGLFGVVLAILLGLAVFRRRVTREDAERKIYCCTHPEPHFKT